MLRIDGSSSFLRLKLLHIILLSWETAAISMMREHTLLVGVAQLYMFSFQYIIDHKLPVVRDHIYMVSRLVFEDRVYSACSTAVSLIMLIVLGRTIQMMPLLFV